ncbi:MAG: AAA family ATPase [Actinobacteria bacterium]|nr:AAA family ATPase [Actinomycetota bacterium]
MAFDHFSPEAREAVDLAKRFVGEDGKLTADVLMAAAYAVGEMSSSIPELATYMEDLKTRRKKVPDSVDVDAGLEPVFEVLDADDFVTIDELMTALLESDAGKGFLVGAGLPAKYVERAAKVVRGHEAPPRPPAAKASSAEAGGAETGEWRSSGARAEALEALSSYGRMLTEGEPPAGSVVEMDVELRRLQKTLLKMKRRNVIVTGHPGTGKTALVLEFARRLLIGDETIDPRLRDCDVFELSPSFLRAGAGVVGEYDKRVSALIKVLEASPKVLMFVDEVHSLLSSGMHQRTAFSDANEAFKQALGRGTITIIGATTIAEYRHHIAPDRALERRFGVLKVDPPSREATIRILEARRPRLEAHYAPLTVPDEMLEKAVDLTDEHLPTRYQPDKAIQILDEACALTSIDDPEATVLTEAAIQEALEDAVGHGLVRPEALTIEKVLEHLQAKIVGQDGALRKIAESFVAGLSAGWGKKGEPQGIFFFGGPTGVGKTETAKQLAKLLGGGREALLRIDCNTIAGRGIDAKGVIANQLLGVPRGYLGYARGEGGLLSKIRDMPECVVLFDEIEKANPAIADLLLQILDEGRVNDTDDNLLDFRRAFIVFTTNAGTTYEAGGGPIGFAPPGQEANTAGSGTPRVTRDSVMDDLRRRGFREEFLGRNIDFVVFEALDQDDIRVILERQLDGLEGAAELQGYTLTWDPAIVDHLVDQWQPRFGVRHLTSILRHRILEQLAIADVQGELQGIEEVRLELAEGEEVGALPTRRIDGTAMVIALS